MKEEMTNRKPDVDELQSKATKLKSKIAIELVKRLAKRFH